MIQCPNCGAQLNDGTVTCPNCGATVGYAAPAQAKTPAVRIVAKVFMIIACIASGWTLIPLCWLIPMTVHYSRAVKENRPVGIGFKIATLLVVNIVAGICMLCDHN